MFEDMVDDFMVIYWIFCNVFVHLQCYCVNQIIIFRSWPRGVDSQIEFSQLALWYRFLARIFEVSLVVSILRSSIVVEFFHLEFTTESVMALGWPLCHDVGPHTTTHQRRNFRYTCAYVIEDYKLEVMFFMVFPVLENNLLLLYYLFLN